MTDIYNAGEIEVTIKLDTSTLKGDFDALKVEAKKGGAGASKHWVTEFGSAIVSGFKAGQFGKQINKELEEQLKSGSPKFVAALKEIGTSGGKELVAAYLKETGKLNGGLKKKTAKIKGLIVGGLKGVAKGGAVGLVLEGLNFGIGKLAEFAAKGAVALDQKLRPGLYAAKEAAEKLTASKDRLNQVFQQSDQYLSKYAQKVDPARKALVDFEAASKSLNKTLERSNGSGENPLDGTSSGVTFDAKEHLDNLDAAKTGQEGLNASVEKYVAAQRLAFKAESMEEYGRLLAQLTEQQNILNDLEQDPKRQADAIKEAKGNIEELNNRLKQTEESYERIDAIPDSEIRAGIDKEIKALTNRNEIMLAQARGDSERVKQLQDQALEQQKINEYMQVYKGDLDDAQEAAAEFMVNLRAARAEREKELAIQERLATLAKQKKSTLNDQLSLARANGDQIAVQALENQLLLEQKIAEYKDAKFDDYENRAQQYVAEMVAIQKEAEQLKKDGLDVQSQIEIATAQGDTDEVDRLQQQQREVELTATYESAGYDPSTANQKAKDRIAAVEAATAERQEREKIAALSGRETQLALEKARFDKDFDKVDELEREIALRQKIQELEGLGLSTDDAKKTAESELVLYDLEKEIEARIRLNDERLAELESELALAQARKDSAVVEDLENQITLLKQRRPYLEDGLSEKDATIKAQGEVDKLADAENIGQVKELFKGGIKAALDGDFDDFLSGKLQSAADSMFDNALDTLLNGLLGAGGPLEGIIGSLFGDGQPGGVDSIFGSIFGGGGKSNATDGATDALGTFTDGLLDAEGGLGGFGGALSSIFGGGGGLGGGIGGILGGLFAGFFADGGVVPRGQFAIVGEQGSEVISSGASPLRVTPINDNYTQSAAAPLIPDGGGARAMQYAPVNNFYGHTQDDLRRSLDQRDRSLKSEMPGLMDRHTFNRKRGMG